MTAFPLPEPSMRAWAATIAQLSAVPKRAYPRGRWNPKYNAARKRKYAERRAGK